MKSMDPKDEEKGFWEALKERIKSEAVDLETLCCGPAIGALKVVCVPSSLKESVHEMAAAPRDQVLMVRVAQGTLGTLDAWVETGAVKSRSEAAAVFIREGLKVRERELQQLKEALSDVEQAKTRLREKAKQVLGTDDDAEPNNDPSQRGDAE